ncbi:MAG: hypothetical protein ACYCW6_13650 [Candidatus Xenobia bacterium]
MGQVYLVEFDAVDCVRRLQDSKHVDGRSDLFNVGLILYEMLTGHLPFEAGDLDLMLVRLACGDADPITTYRPDLLANLVAWVDRLLRRDPAQRFKSADAASRDLLAIHASLS